MELYFKNLRMRKSKPQKKKPLFKKSTNTTEVLNYCTSLKKCNIIHMKSIFKTIIR